MLLGNLYNKVHYPARLEGVLFFLFRKPKSDLKNGLDCVVDLFLSCTHYHQTMPTFVQMQLEDVKSQYTDATNLTDTSHCI